MVATTRPQGRSRIHLAYAAALCGIVATSAHAASADDAKGLWLTEQKDAVIEFTACAGAAGSLCGRIVWDKDAGTAADTCGTDIARLNRYAGDAWRDGWVYDPRDRKTYKATVRATGRELAIRAFVGVEILGETERLTRVDALPASPVCKPLPAPHP